MIQNLGQPPAVIIRWLFLSVFSATGSNIIKAPEYLNVVYIPVIVYVLHVDFLFFSVV